MSEYKILTEYIRNNFHLNAINKRMNVIEAKEVYRNNRSKQDDISQYLVTSSKENKSISFCMSISIFNISRVTG